MHDFLFIFYSIGSAMLLLLIVGGALLLREYLTEIRPHKKHD